MVCKMGKRSKGVIGCVASVGPPTLKSTSLEKKRSSVGVRRSRNGEKKITLTRCEGNSFSRVFLEKINSVCSIT